MTQQELKKLIKETVVIIENEIFYYRNIKLIPGLTIEDVNNKDENGFIKRVKGISYFVVQMWKTKNCKK